MIKSQSPNILSEYKLVTIFPNVLCWILHILLLFSVFLFKNFIANKDTLKKIDIINVVDFAV